MKYGIANVKAKSVSENLSPYYYGLTPPDDTNKLWIRTSATPVSESIKYYLPLTDNPTSLTQETLIYDGRLALGRPCCFAYKTYIYIIGGNLDGDSTDLIRRYNLETETLEVLDTTFPVKIARATPIVIGDNAYIVGGYTKIGSSTTQLTSIYKVNLKTMEITLEQSDADILSEIYNIFKFDEETIVWVKPRTAYVFCYNINTKVVERLASKENSDGVNFACQNKYGFFTSMGSNYAYTSRNTISLTPTSQGVSIGQSRKAYSYNNLQATRSGLGVFCIGKYIYCGGGTRSSNSIDKIEKINMFSNQTEAVDLTNTLPNAGNCIGVSISENTKAFVMSSYIVLLKDEFTLNENESILEIDENGNIINCYIGNSSNKAELFRVYKYNALTEKWEGVNCQDYSE